MTADEDSIEAFERETFSKESTKKSQDGSTIQVTEISHKKLLTEINGKPTMEPTMEIIQKSENESVREGHEKPTEESLSEMTAKSSNDGIEVSGREPVMGITEKTEEEPSQKEDTQNEESRINSRVPLTNTKPNTEPIINIIDTDSVGNII